MVTLPLMEVLRPRTVAEACQALAEIPGVTILAGGTDLMIDVNLRHLRPTTVLSTRDIEELRVRSADWIGAGVTFADLVSATDAGLAEASRTVGSPQIRAAGTIGGNLGTASPAGDALPYLACLDARVVLASASRTRKVPMADFLTGPKRTDRRPDELITGIELPGERPERQGFSKVGIRQAMVIAIASCCVVRSRDGRVRVALGSVAPTVVRARDAEELIASEPDPSEAALDEFQRLVSAAASPISDQRATAGYRRHAVGVIARRTLERLL